MKQILWTDSIFIKDNDGDIVINIHQSYGDGETECVASFGMSRELAEKLTIDLKKLFTKSLIGGSKA